MFGTIKRIDAKGALYSLDYTRNIDLDKVLDAEIKDPYELIGYGISEMGMNIDITNVKLEPGCSSFTAGSGDTFRFCRNYDYLGENSAAVVIHMKPEKGYETVGFADIGGIGFQKGMLDDGKSDLSFLTIAPLLMTDGMNEKGLVISAMVLDEDPVRQNRGKKKIMTTVAIRMLLERAATVDEAIAMLDEYDMTSPSAPSDFHFMIADTTGKTRVIEYINNEMSVLDTRYSSNFYLSEAMRGKGHGFRRYNVIESGLLEDNYEISEDKAWEILKVASQYGNEDFCSFTLWSVIYDPNKKTMEMIVERNFDNKYKYQLGKGWIE